MGKEDAILGSTQLNKVIGMIIPPPEIKKIIDRAAQLVAKYGVSVEQKMQYDPSPKFSFLKEGDPYNNYYEQRIIQITELLKREEEEEKLKQQQVQISKDAALQETFLNNKRKADQSVSSLLQTNQFIDKNNKLQEELRQLIKEKEIEMNLTNNLNDIKAPKPDKFSISHPNIPGLDMDIIKNTAQFVARNGQRFLTDLSERESKNSQFHFLKPQHNLFGYFTYLVGSYSEILHNRKEEISKLASFSSNKNDVLKQAMNKVLYEKKLKNLQKVKGGLDDLDEKNNKRKAQIDWYDFVIVDVIDFAEEDQYQHIQQQQQHITTINNHDDIEVIDATTHKKEDNNQWSDHEDEDEEETITQLQPKLIPITEVVTEEPTPLLTQEGIKIKKDYIRQKHTDNIEDTVKCPLCKENIPRAIINEHMKLEQLDPKWKEMQKELSKRTSNAIIPQMSSYLNDFTNSRPDLYGNISDIHTIEEKRQKESKQQHAAPIWNGYDPNMSRTTANITMFKQQNQKHIAESKKRNEKPQ